MVVGPAVDLDSWRSAGPLRSLSQVPPKSPGPASVAGPGQKTTGRQPAWDAVTHHPKPMGQWRAQGQCPTPTKVTPSETTCLGLFRALRCTIAVIFKLTPKIA